MSSALGRLARLAVLVPPVRVPNADVSRRSDLEPYGLRAGCLRKFDRGKGDDRHRADSDPGNGNAREVWPGKTTSRTSGSNRADDRVDVAQSRDRVANRRVLGHAGFPEVSDAVLKMVLKLTQDAAALPPSAAQRVRQSGQELGSGVAANLQPPRARAQIRSRSHDSGAASSQTAPGAQSGSWVTRRTRVGAGRRRSPNDCGPALLSRACGGPDTAFLRGPQAPRPSERAAPMRSHNRAGDPAEESPTGDRQAVLGSSAYLVRLCIGNRGVKCRSSCPAGASSHYCAARGP